jgi:ABC-type sugar transport system ATPase subunit
VDLAANPPAALIAAGALSEALLEMRSISKRFPGVVALDNVDFDLRRGEVHVLFGENGAGKSTLINIIAGTYPPDTGTFKYQGKEITYLTPHGARVIGISPVFQEFSLVPELSVEENLFLGRETTAGDFLNRAAMRSRAPGIAGLVGCGKSEIVRAIVGLEPLETGTIRVRGEDIAAPTPSTMLKNGVCYFPSDRVAEGLALARPVRENVSMAALDLPVFSRRHILQRRGERRIVQGIVDKPSLRPPQIERAVVSFSGGNRPKILLARGLTRDISVYLFDEPTVGVDVGAKIEIYELMKSLLATGLRSCWSPPIWPRCFIYRIGSTSCTARVWLPNSSVPTSTSRRCCRISSASNKRATGRGLPRETVRGSLHRQ